MARLKTFLMYASWVILFFIFSQVMIYVALNTTYKYKKVDIQSKYITHVEAQATSINGFTKCTVKNDEENSLEGKYIKIDCYSKNEIKVGTKYIRIENIPTNEEKEIETRFNYSRVDRVEINIVDEISEEVTENQKISDPEMNAAMVITALILLINFG